MTTTKKAAPPRRRQKLPPLEAGERDRLVAEFYARGGSVTVIPPVTMPGSLAFRNNSMARQEPDLYAAHAESKEDVASAVDE